MNYLRNIKFPVYPIPNAGIISKENEKLIYTVKSGNQYIIDDLSFSGSFAVRRLKSTQQLLPLKRAILTIGNLIVYSSIYRRFVDSTGKIFKYKKSYFVPLVIRKIEKSIPYRSGSTLLVENTHCPFMFYRQLKEYENYAILAKFSQGYILIGVSTRNYLRRDKIKL